MPHYRVFIVAVIGSLALAGCQPPRPPPVPGPIQPPPPPGTHAPALAGR